MSAEELENYETDAQLALYREYRDVMSLFTHAVDTDRRFYLANHVEVIPRVSDGTVYFEVLMSDVWVWDVFRTNRFVKTVRVLSTHDVNVEERLPNQEFSIPDMGVRTLFDIVYEFRRITQHTSDIRGVGFELVMNGREVF